MSDDTDTIMSRYPEMDKAPEFAPAIPAHLVAKLTDSERYLVTSISKMEQQNNWVATQIVVHNKAICETDVRVQKLEWWKKLLTSKWAIAAWLAGAGLTIYGKDLGVWLLKHVI